MWSDRSIPRKKKSKGVHLLVDAMLNLLVTSERILSAKRLLVIANLASDLLARSVVDCVFMTSEVVRS